MKQRMLIFLSFIGLIALLIGINAASYRQKDKEPDFEDYPNRSTFNSGATGTRAFYDFLSETGYKVTRWQESPISLLSSSNQLQTFVIIGTTRLEINENETKNILDWVAGGGKLVIIDRQPPFKLVSTTTNWTLKRKSPEVFAFGVDPLNQQQMTIDTPAIKPSQPSIFTRGINAVQPSRFASSIELTFGINKEKEEVAPSPYTIIEDDEPPPVARPSSTPYYEPPPPKATPKPTAQGPAITVEKDTDHSLNAPFVHLSDGKKNILVDVPYGSGQIVYLTDPYLVSNAGIGVVDNLHLAVNVVGSREGLIAFDEYHHGYGANARSIFGYFAGTPVIAIFVQICLLVAVIFWSQSRRFARPLPADESNRLSKLEYVSAMAELQQRTKAYDLAVENIFSEFRRSVTRLLGMDNFSTSRKELAKAISERLKLNELDIYNLMRKCEAIIQGEKTSRSEVLELTGRLREIEEKLGLKRTRKQAFRK